MLITHDMGVVKQICDRVAILEKGQVVEKGKVADLAAQPTSRLAQDFFPRRHEYQAHPGGVLATIAFQGKVARQPILTTLVRQFGLEVNILNGSVETIGEQPVGQFQLELAGKEVKPALEYLHSLGIEVEVP
jgi:D-methionine transport system ATP-binding protein